MNSSKLKSQQLNIDNKTLNNIQSQSLHTFTLIYLVSNDSKEVLLMKRDQSKKMLPGKIIGLGGHVEPGEDLIASAQREFMEETGLTLIDPKLKGTYTWIGDVISGVSHIVVARKHSGIMHHDNPEGELAWHKIDQLKNISNFAQYQLHFISDVLSKNSNHHSSIGIYHKNKEVFYKDNSSYFKSRKK